MQIPKHDRRLVRQIDRLCFGAHQRSDGHARQAFWSQCAPNLQMIVAEERLPELPTAKKIHVLLQVDTASRKRTHRIDRFGLQPLRQHHRKLGFAEILQPMLRSVRGELRKRDRFVYHLERIME